MNVSSYLEAFLSVYGWDVYYVIYLALAASGLFLYPLARSVIEIFIDAQTDARDDTLIGSLMSIIVTICLMALVFITTLVPIVPIALDKMEVTSVCGKSTLPTIMANNAGKYRFIETDKVRVPILSWTAMAIGHGMVNVINKVSPCTSDITEIRKAQMNVSLDNADNPDELKTELKRYSDECQVPIRNAIVGIMDGKYGIEAQNFLRDKIREISKDERGFWEDFLTSDKLTAKEEKLIMNSPDSRLIREVFFEQNANIPESIKNIPASLNAAQPVKGYIGLPNGSPQQGTETPPSCSDWWQGQSGQEGLRMRLVEGLSNDIVAKAARWNGPKECQPKMVSIPASTGSYNGGWLGNTGGPGNSSSSPFGGGKLIPLDDAQKTACRKRVVNDIWNGDEKKYAQELMASIQGNDTIDTITNNIDEAKVGGLVLADIVSGVVAKFTGIDLSNGILQTIASFYGTMYFLKLMLKFLLPMIMMAVYMFWGIYLVIAAFEGRAIVKGMIMIIALTIVPSLWALVEHLDDKLWDSMYAGSSASGAVFEMIVLDAATSIFQIAIVYILFHVVNMAGGGDAGATMKNSNQYATQLSTQASGSVSTVAGKSLGRIQNTIGKLGARGWNKFKGWSNKG